MFHLYQKSCFTLSQHQRVDSLNVKAPKTGWGLHQQVEQKLSISHNSHSYPQNDTKINRELPFEQYEAKRPESKCKRCCN